MEDSLKARAEQRFLEALEASGGRDPREFYRQRLRDLKASDPPGFRQGAAYYQDRLIPEIAEGEIDPLVGWLEYGRFLAEIVEEGTTVVVDESGRSHPYEPNEGARFLVLHIPSDSRKRAILVGLPPKLSAPQKATFDLLVEGKKR